MKQAETYYLKAVSNFPFDVSEVCEALNYALSYEPDFAPALCLKGKLYMNERINFKEARACFEQALRSDPTYIDIYPAYGELLLQIEEFDTLEQLIDRSLKVTGINKANMYLLRAKLYERQKNYRSALLTMNIAAEESYNEEMDKTIEGERKRIEDKLARKNGKTIKKKTATPETKEVSEVG